MATRGSFFTRGKSSFARTPVPAPAPKPSQTTAAVAAPAVLTTPPNSYNQSQLAELRKADQSLGNVAKSAYSPADLARIQQEQSKAMLQQPQQASGLKAVPYTAQKMPGASAPSKPDALISAFNQSQQAAAQVPQSPSKAMLSYQEAVKAGTAGDMAKPAFKKGGVVKKKPGYAKGGAVAKKTAASKYAKGGMATPKASNCGASMKPQQRKK